jgi:hypothetical protein
MKLAVVRKARALKTFDPQTNEMSAFSGNSKEAGHLASIKTKMNRASFYFLDSAPRKAFVLK